MKKGSGSASDSDWRDTSSRPGAKDVLRNGGTGPVDEPGPADVDRTLE